MIMKNNPNQIAIKIDYKTMLYSEIARNRQLKKTISGLKSQITFLNNKLKKTNKTS